MASGNIILDKSYKFALLTVRTCQMLQKEQKEFIITRQLLRSATSIGSNVEEAIGGQSKKDFIAKMQISYKEARETKYWLRLLNDAEYLVDSVSNHLINDCEELCRIISSILKSSKDNS